MSKLAIIEAAFQEFCGRDTTERTGPATWRTFCEVLSKFPEARGTLSPSQLSKYRGGSASLDMRTRFEAACSALVSSWKISESELLKRHPAMHREAQQGGMTGAWFLIQYRAARRELTEAVPRHDIRVAALIYGQKRGEKQQFEIVGNQTAWRGSVQKIEDHFVFDAMQYKSPFAKECLRIVLHQPHKDLKHGQHGLMLGVVYSENDHPEFPIYASRVSLFPMMIFDIDLRLPLGTEALSRLNAICGYMTQTDIDAAPEPKDSSVAAQRIRAVRAFRKLHSAPGNYGDRLFSRK